MTIHTSDLTRSFGSKDVLTGVDLDLGPGIHGLLGRNGVGKSTLLRLSLIHISEPTRRS